MNTNLPRSSEIARNAEISQTGGFTKEELEDIRMYVWDEVNGLVETDDYCYHVFLHVVDRMVRTSESREAALAYCLKHPEPFEQPFGD